MTLALFPLIVPPVLRAFALRQPPYEPKSDFYSQWASAYTGYGKGGGGRVIFFAEDAECFRIKRATFREVPVCLVTINFRRKFLFRRGNGHFAIRVDTETQLEQMQSWARAHKIEIKDSRTDPSTGSG